MEAVIDKIISDISEMTSLPSESGGLSDILPIVSVSFGDPGVLPTSQYPMITVVPVNRGPNGETTGYDKRKLYIEVSLYIDARDFFEEEKDEGTGDRTIVQATTKIESWFLRKSKRQLDGLDGVVNVEVEGTSFTKRDRSNLLAKSSRITLVVTKNYDRVA
jgi:hypothetical protein